MGQARHDGDSGLNFALTLMGLSLVGQTFLARYYLLFKDNEQSGVRMGAAFLDLEGVFSTLNLINVSTAVEFGVMVCFGYVLHRIAVHYGAIVDGTLPPDLRSLPSIAGRSPPGCCCSWSIWPFSLEWS